jgi:DNA end-binding protein Ku
MPRRAEKRDAPLPAPVRGTTLDPMARAIWSGAISFGLVNIPVKLTTAVMHKEVRFHMLHDADGARIHMKRCCSLENKEVPYEHVVKGYELTKGRYVTLTAVELERFDPEATRTVEIHEFVDLAEVDPVYYETTYHLAPDRGAAKAYALLLEAMRRTGKVALATFVLRTKEYLAAVRPFGRALALTTMNRADEIVPESSLELPEAPKPGERELQMAEQLVASLAAPFQPERYPDTYREKVLELVRRKAEGQPIEAPAPEERPAEVVNLADALSASLAAARERAGRQGPGEEAGARRHRVAQAARTAGRRRKGKGPA